MFNWVKKFEQGRSRIYSVGGMGGGKSAVNLKGQVPDQTSQTITQVASGPARKAVQLGTESAIGALEQAQSKSTPFHLSEAGQAFGGNLFAKPTELQGEARLGAEDFVRSLDNPGQSFLDLGQKTAEGGFLDFDSNPYLQGAINSALSPIEAKLTNETLPAIASQSIDIGANSGARRALLEGQAVGDAASNAQNVAANLAFQNYNQERQNQINSANLVNQGIDLGQQPFEFLDSLGARDQANEQALIDEARQKQTLEQLGGFAGLPEFASILSSLPLGTQSNTHGTVQQLQADKERQLGQKIGTIGGTAIGAYFGGPQGASAGGAAGSSLGSLFDG